MSSETSAPGRASSLGPDESFALVRGRSTSGIVLLCDHAGNAVPPTYGSLGLTTEDLERHIAWDIGAAGVTRELARRLDAPALLTRYSRLLIDCNRGLDDPTLIMRLSDGRVIEGNRHLDAAEREKRIARYYEPYHAAIDRVIDGSLVEGTAPALVSIHTFTPIWKDSPRPWHVGVLWDRDPRLAVPLIAALRADGDLVVGDNEPYSGSLEGDCLWRHGTSRGLAHALIEIRQDLVETEAGQQAWADRLARLLTALLAEQHVRADVLGLERV